MKRSKEVKIEFANRLTYNSRNEVAITKLSARHKDRFLEGLTVFRSICDDYSSYIIEAKHCMDIQVPGRPQIHYSAH